MFGKSYVENRRSDSDNQTDEEKTPAFLQKYFLWSKTYDPFIAFYYT